MRLLEGLGIGDAMKSRMRFFPNGYAAMKWLAESGGANDVGITQNTEILPNKGVTYIAPLPDAFQMKTVYTAAVAAGSASESVARDFIARLVAPGFRSNLEAAGYEIG